MAAKEHRTRATAMPRSPSALHTMEQYANNPVEADYVRLKVTSRLPERVEMRLQLRANPLKQVPGAVMVLF
jgi:hypothetical protein